MSAYIYRITAKTIRTPVGWANVAKFAYKPVWGMDEDAEKRNNTMHRQSGCYASERMVRNGNHSGRAALVDENGNVVKVYATDNTATFYDDNADERFPIMWDREEDTKLSPTGAAMVDAACIAITGQSWDVWKTCVGGNYRPSVDVREFPASTVDTFAAAFYGEFGREIYRYGAKRAA